MHIKRFNVFQDPRQILFFFHLQSYFFHLAKKVKQENTPMTRLSIDCEGLHD